MKSTQSCIPAMRKGKRWPLLAILGGLLLMFPLLSPATALAAARNAATAPPLTKPQQIVDLAGVSVVRLSLAYHPAQGTTSIFCTALGTILASWPAQNATDQNTWVLTDGTLLLASKKNTCAPGGTLQSITVLASNEFTNNQLASPPLAFLTCSAASVCSDSLNGSAGSAETLLTSVNNAVLFSFHSATPLPFVDVEKAPTTGTPAPTAIELANGNNAIPSTAKKVDATTLDLFLTPLANATASGSTPSTPGTASAQSSEPGMPFIDGNGKITGAQLFNTTSLVTIADLENLENQLVLPAGQTLSQLLNSNTLSQQWDTGIIDYEQGNESGAIQTLSPLQNASPTFQAPAAFIAKAQAASSPIHGTPGATSTTSNGQSNQGVFSFLSIPLLVIGLAGVFALVLLFLIVSLRFGRRRIERKRELNTFKADEERARQRVEGKERQVPQQYSPSPPFYSEAVNYPVAAPSPAPAPPDSRCPNCGKSIEEHATFCPNCRYPLKDAESRRFPSPPPTLAPISADTRPTEQPKQPEQAPKMQDDPAIRAALERLWDKAGR